tara:strand:+ start:1519 stop:2367 length:849 start_codon:yes stop_codon:yes gene_type:complete
MIELRKALSIGRGELMEEGIKNSFLESKLLIKDILSISDEDLALSKNLFLTANEYKIYRSFLERRKQSEPIAYILNKKDFWKHSFYVNSSTLIPRNDSEIIIETILKIIPDINSKLKFADLGTGSGCLIISILNEYKYSDGIGIDNSKDAIKVAKRNKNILFNKERLSLELGDFSLLETAEFDVIICNPPYVNKNHIRNLQKDILKYEPYQALFADEGGFIYYKKIIHNLNKNYKYGQKVFFEIGIGQSEVVTNLLKNNDFKIVEITNDINGIPRCIAAERI